MKKLILALALVPALAMAQPKTPAEAYWRSIGIYEACVVAEARLVPIDSSMDMHAVAEAIGGRCSAFSRRILESSVSVTDEKGYLENFTRDVDTATESAAKTLIRRFAALKNTI